MKKILLLIMCLLISGCTDYVEINDLVIISAMAIDYKDNEYELTSQLIINEQNSTIKTITTKAKTIEQAISEISNYSNKEIFISHLKVLILTEDLIKKDINFCDYFLRNPKSKMNFNIYITDSKTAKEILNLNKDIESSSLYIEKMSDFNKRTYSSSTKLPFIDYIYKKLEPGIKPVYPNITIKNNNEEKLLYLDGISFLNKDFQIIKLNDEESISFNILTNNINKTTKNINCGNDDNLFSITLQDVKTKYIWKNNTLELNTNATANINYYDCNYDLDIRTTIKKLNNISKNHITKELEKIIEIQKENKSDILGIGNYIYKHDYKYFNNIENWEENLKNLNTKINFELNITSIGEKRK